MNTELLQLLGVVLLCVLPLDVVPPVNVAVLALGAVIALGVFVVAIVILSFFVIKRVKKNRSLKQ